MELHKIQSDFDDNTACNTDRDLFAEGIQFCFFADSVMKPDWVGGLLELMHALLGVRGHILIIVIVCAALLPSSKHVAHLTPEKSPSQRIEKEIDGVSEIHESTSDIESVGHSQGHGQFPCEVFFGHRSQHIEFRGVNKMQKPTDEIRPG